MKTKKLILGLISISMLIVGLILYLLFNPQAYVSILFLDYFSCLKISLNQNLFFTFLRNYGADFLWATSFTLVVQLILWFEKKKTFFLTCTFLLGASYELMQGFGIATGTADIFDVIAYLFGSIVAIIIIRGGKFYEKK